jgi:hypothetical protein
MMMMMMIIIVIIIIIIIIHSEYHLCVKDFQLALKLIKLINKIKFL